MVERKFIRQPKSNKFVAPIPAIPLIQPMKTGDELLEYWQRECADDPLSFVLEEWAWGQSGTPLENEEGPDTWQIDVLTRIREHYQSDTAESLKLAVASGHGIGKTTLSVWVILWFLATHPHCQIVATTTAGHNLNRNTWRELSKWLGLSKKVKDYFEWTPTRCRCKKFPETWFASAVANNPNNAEAFAGLHEQAVLVVLDEASGIAELIWETVEGALTSGRALWLAFGNPLDPAGRFRQCFPGGRFARWWQSVNIDSRTCKKADKTDIAFKLAAYGEDSDYFKMRVRGEFPTKGSQQLIGEDILQLAKQCVYVHDATQAIVIGVDPARYGDCRSVIIVREGARILEKKAYNDMDSIRVAGYVIETIEKYKRHEYGVSTFIDSIGVGAGVYDQCRARGYNVQEARSSFPAKDTQHYANMRAQMADLMKEWIATFACLDYDRELEADLINIQYFYNVKGQLQIESKEDMRARGIASPDIADALSYTFADKTLKKVRAWGASPRVFAYR